MTSPPEPTSMNGESNYLRYVEQMAEQLQGLIRGPRYRPLRYLLDMARLEARTRIAEIEARGRLTAEQPTHR